jgi:tellurite resistance protein TehA-like permease
MDTYCRIVTHEQSIDKLTAVWLLPIVPPIVAAGVGGNLCLVIPQAAISPTLIASYVCWGIGVPFAMNILVLYLHRLTIYKVTEYSAVLI